MKKLRNIIIVIFILLLVSIVAICVTYRINMKPMDKNDSTIILVEIPNGTSKSQIGDILKEKELIRSSTFFKVYIKIFKVGELKASTYKLSKDMDFKTIINTLEEGNSYNPNQIKLMFKEGINFEKVAHIISQSTNNKYEDIISLTKDEKYLDELIEKYWFLTDDIKNVNIRYPLEGYLFPETYFFNDNVTTKEIFSKMLDQTSKILNNYKEVIEKSDMSIHEVITLASIIEKEGKTSQFKDISSVFYNRLKRGMKLESCATSYYGMSVEFDEVGIATNEMLNNVNPYNTYVVEKLPVGPISMPSKDAIDAAIYPVESSNLYFLSDNTGYSYFFENYGQQQVKKNELINNDKWNR